MNSLAVGVFIYVSLFGVLLEELQDPTLLPLKLLVCLFIITFTGFLVFLE